MKRKRLVGILKKGIGLLIFLGIALSAGMIDGNWHLKSVAEKKIWDDWTALSDQKMAGDCILVLGCGLRPDGEPTQMLKDRLDEAVALYKQGMAPKLLMSGDHGRVQYDEVNKMKEYAMAQGIPSEDIFMDHAGFSTYESAYRAKEIFQVQSMIVVTQQYHLYRAVYDGNSLGIDTWGVPAKKVRYGGQTRRDLREVLARNKDLFYCMIKPEPTYLGEAIPVSGNGNVTNDKD